MACLFTFENVLVINGICLFTKVQNILSFSDLYVYIQNVLKCFDMVTCSDMFVYIQKRFEMFVYIQKRFEMFVYIQKRFGMFVYIQKRFEMFFDHELALVVIRMDNLYICDPSPKVVYINEFIFNSYYEIEFI